MSATNSTSSNLFPSISFGNNLLEISALTTLIGSTAAESLVMGNRGAAGVAWATTSAFGLLWIIRACISGACSGWLRETIGVRTAISDQAIGLYLTGDSKGSDKVRRNIGAAIGIFRKIPPADIFPEKGKQKSGRHWRDVYAFDHAHSGMFTSIPESEPGSLRVFTYADYRYTRLHSVRFQSIAIILSLGKLIECFVVTIYGGGLLGISTAVPWAYFFMFAVYLETQEIILRKRPEDPEGELDIIAGRLPTTSQPGGTRKILLGVASNPRTMTWWRSIWALGAVVSTISLLLTYFLLGQQTKQVVYMWAGFQVFWMGARVLVHYYADSKDPLAYRALAERPWATVPTSLRLRIIDLAVDLARYQTTIHPRGEIAYRDDSFDSKTLAAICSNDAFFYSSYPFHNSITSTSSVQVDILSVVGDTMLSSIAWIAGSTLAPKDLYDSCILTLSIAASVATTSQTISVPAARVLAGIPVIDIPDREANEASYPQFPPRGLPNLGVGISWWYYILCSSGSWLLIKRNAGTTMIGKAIAEVLSDNQVTALLSAGNLHISIAHVDEVKQIIDFSQKAHTAIIKLVES